MEATPLTAEMVDGEYRVVCAELGQLFVQREALDRALDEKRQALFQIVARHRAVAHNESIPALTPHGK